MPEQQSRFHALRVSFEYPAISTGIWTSVKYRFALPLKIIPGPFKYTSRVAITIVYPRSFAYLRTLAYAWSQTLITSSISDLDTPNAREFSHGNSFNQLPEPDGHARFKVGIALTVLIVVVACSHSLVMGNWSSRSEGLRRHLGLKTFITSGSDLQLQATSTAATSSRARIPSHCGIRCGNCPRSLSDDARDLH